MQTMLDQVPSRRRANGPYETLNPLWDQVLFHEQARESAGPGREGQERGPATFEAADATYPGWAHVTHNRAETRGQGYPMAQWDTHDVRLKHYPGHDVDMMYFKVPLHGDFQLDCELSSTPGRKIRVIYGGVGLAPGNDPKTLELTSSAVPRPISCSTHRSRNWAIGIRSGWSQRVVACGVHERP